MKHRIVSTATVLSLDERKGEGWWVRVSESSSIFIGFDKPVGLEKGMDVKHAIEWEIKE